MIVKSVVLQKNQASAAKDSLSLFFTQYYLFISENIKVEIDKKSENTFAVRI